MQFEPNKKAAAILRKYEPITLNVEHNPSDVSYFDGAGWREFGLGTQHWLINDVEVAHTEWQIVFYCLFPDYGPVETDELTKWDFIDLDEEAVKILDKINRIVPASPQQIA